MDRNHPFEPRSKKKKNEDTVASRKKRKGLSLVRFFKEYCGSIHPFKDPVYSFGYLCVRLNRATGSSHSQAEQQKQPTAKARGGCRCRTDPLPLPHCGASHPPFSAYWLIIVREIVEEIVIY